MVRLIARIKARGVRQPALVRPDPEGGYEIIDGHRRYRASVLAERPDMPVIIRDLSDEEAVAEMVDGNVQRENDRQRHPCRPVWTACAGHSGAEGACMTQFTIRGHDLLAVERFRDDTRHMIEFEVLKDDNLIALRGETARLFLNERGYQRALQSQELGEIHIISHALVIEGHIIRPKKKRHH